MLTYINKILFFSSKTNKEEKENYYQNVGNASKLQHTIMNAKALPICTDGNNIIIPTKMHSLNSHHFPSISNLPHQDLHTKELYLKLLLSKVAKATSILPFPPCFLLYV